MNDTEATQQNKRPARPYNPNRRTTPSEYKRTIQSLTKAIEKEEKRTHTVKELQKTIHQLHADLTRLRQAHLGQG
jgi:hypothetical protein